MSSENYYYIAGPMSGIKDYNRVNFEKAEKFLNDQGISSSNIFNPIDHEASILVQNGQLSGQDAYRTCLKMDLDWICDWATHIYMLQGWNTSKGAHAEWSLAVALGLTIQYQ